MKEHPRYGSWDTMRYLLGNAWEADKGLFLFCALFAFSNAAIPFLGIFLPKLLLDQLTGPRDARTVAAVLGCYAMLSIGLALLRDRARSLFGPRVTRIRMGFIERINRKVLGMDYVHAENPAVHDRIRKSWKALGNNTDGVEGILNVLFALVGSAVSFTGYAAVITTLSPWILLLLAVSVLARAVASHAEKRFEHGAESTVVPLERRMEYVDGTLADPGFGKEVRLFGMAGWLEERYRDLCAELHRWIVRIRARRFGVDALEGLLALFRDGVAYGILVERVVRHGMGIGDFSMYFAAVAGLSGWMNDIANAFLSIRRQNLYVNDYRAFLEMPDRGNRPRKAETPGRGGLPCRVEFREVTFRYPQGGAAILDGLSLSIAAGERLALVGANGAGKTTLVKLLCGLYDPDGGSILIDGTDTRDFPREDLYGLFSVVFQDPKLYAFTVAENVALRPEGGVDRARVRSCLEKAGLGGRIASLGKGLDTNLLRILDPEGIELSGGEAQKLALARALYKDAPIVVLDEPTSSLDALAEHALYMGFDSLVGGRTALYISHRLGSTKFCDRVALLSGGRVAEYGTHDLLMERGGEYAAMFRTQARYYREEEPDGA